MLWRGIYPGLGGGVLLGWTVRSLQIRRQSGGSASGGDTTYDEGPGLADITGTIRIMY